MKKIVWLIIKILISIIAIGNLVWFLVFDYKNPFIPVKNNDKENLLTESNEDKEGYYLKIPLNSLKYNGIGEFDPLKDVYVVDEKGVRIDSAEITYTIKPRIENNLREKLIEYEAVVFNETLYGKRDLSLGVDYTGPSIFVKRALPYCKEGGLVIYTEILKKGDYLEVLDGFKNDIKDDIEVTLKNYNKEEELAIITISVTNIYQDSYSIDYQIPMNDTGIVLILDNDKVIVDYGSTFDIKKYIDQCYFETESNSLLDKVLYKGEVNTNKAGKYNIVVFVQTEGGISSIERPLEVIVTDIEETEDD